MNAMTLLEGTLLETKPSPNQSQNLEPQSGETSHPWNHITSPKLNDGGRQLTP